MMTTIAGTATFADPSTAAAAAAALTDLRHRTDTEIDGGSVDQRGNTITFGYRLRDGLPRARTGALVKQLRQVLAAGEVTLTEPRHVPVDEEQYVDKETGEVRVHQANRVVQVGEDGTARTLITRTRLLTAVDETTGEQFGRVPFRTVLDADTGEAVVLDRAAGLPDPAVTVDKH